MDVFFFFLILLNFSFSILFKDFRNDAWKQIQPAHSTAATHLKLWQGFHKFCKALHASSSDELLGWLAKSHPNWASLRIGWDGCNCCTFFWAFILQHHPSGAPSTTGRDWTTALNYISESRKESVVGGCENSLIWRSTCSLKRLLFNKM